MKKIRNIPFQKILDNIIDKVFLRFIPRTVTPNQVTVIRFILTPVVYWLLVSHQFQWALAVFVIAASTDFIDGTMARTRDQITDVGKVIDPIADKLLILSVFVVIGFDLLIVKIFVVFIVFELIAVLFGSWFSFVIGKPTGANVFGKIKLILQALGVTMLLTGVLINNGFLLESAGWVLITALFFAVVSGMEIVRRKALYLKDNKIVYSRPDQDK